MSGETIFFSSFPDGSKKLSQGVQTINIRAIEEVKLKKSLMAQRVKKTPGVGLCDRKTERQV